MKKKFLKLFSVLLLAMMLIVASAGCSNGSSNGEVVVTDLLGREVTLSSDIQTAVAIGPGALRLYCYAGDTEKLCGIEQIEIDSTLGRAYMIANSDLQSLPVIGAGGPANSPDAEKLIAAAPDVIFTTYASDASAADELQAKTGIPVIALSYGSTAPFSDNLNASLTLIGQVMGTEKQAKTVVNYLNDCKADLNKRTSGISDSDKPTVYYGAQSMKGAHGIESTTGNYSLFNVLNTKSVVDTADISGYVMLDKEQLLEWNPDVIFIDLGGLSLVKQDYTGNPGYYAALSAFEDGEVYSQLPYNYYSTNIDVALIDAYYMGTVLYPDEFKDVDIAKFANDTFKTMLGTDQDIYSELVDSFGTLGQLTFN
ncbi:MAG: iron ABC transporter substrate-binding protein [Anaerofustis sp.]